LSLVEAYTQIGVDLHKPHLRSNLESQMKLIALGKQKYEDVMAEAIVEFKKIFHKALDEAENLKNCLWLRV